MGYTVIYCHKCDKEYKVEHDVILSYSGRKNILCSSCGDVLLNRRLIIYIKQELSKKELSGVSNA